MRSKNITFSVVVLFIFFLANLRPSSAQLTLLECGSIVTGEFTGNDQVHLYEIRLNVGDSITVSGNALDASLKFNIVLYGPSGVLIEASDPYLYGSQNNPEVSTPSVRSRSLSASGTYTIRAVNGYFYGYNATINEDGKDDPIGGYQLQISCLLQNGEQIPAGTPVPYALPESPSVIVTLPIVRNQSITPLNCGEVIASEFTQFSEIQRYSVDVASDDQAIWISVTTIGSYLKTALAVANPSGEIFLDEYGEIASSPSLELAGPFRSGTYMISVSNSQLSTTGSGITQLYPNSLELDHNGGVGKYAVGVGCRLADGTTINPGDIAAEEQAIISATQAPASVPTLVTSCPNSPPPRLSIGLPAQITPGDSNNLRDEPNSTTVIGQIPTGEQSLVLDGPVCGINGLTFWKVQYGEVTGWTAEGQGTDYWLEPVQSGRG